MSEEEDKDEIEIVHHDENDYLIAYAYAIRRHDEKAEVIVVPICKIIFFFTILQSSILPILTDEFFYNK